MATNISQVHQAALAFRTQFRPLIEVLDYVAGLDSLENYCRELTALKDTLEGEYKTLQKKVSELREKHEEVEKQIEQDKRLAEKQTQAVAEEIKMARRKAEVEQDQVRAKFSAAIDRDKIAAAEKLAEAGEAVKQKEQEVAVLEARLEMLRKAIADIVAGAEK